MESSQGVMAKILVSDLEVSEFELQSHYNIHFRTNHLQVALTTQISLTLTLSIHLSLSSIASGWSSKLHPVSAQSRCQ